MRCWMRWIKWIWMETEWSLTTRMDISLWIGRNWVCDFAEYVMFDSVSTPSFYHNQWAQRWPEVVREALPVDADDLFFHLLVLADCHCFRLRRHMESFNVADSLSLCGIQSAAGKQCDQSLEKTDWYFSDFFILRNVMCTFLFRRWRLQFRRKL